MRQFVPEYVQPHRTRQPEKCYDPEKRAQRKKPELWSPSAAATITYNNIFNNTENIHLTDFGNVTAIYNWWGTTDASAINQTIWDFKNDTNLGIVTFEPFLNESCPLAPSIPTLGPVPTPPPTSAPTVTATPYASPTPHPSVTPTPTTTPFITWIGPSTPLKPVQSPLTPILGHFTSTDIDNIVVIALAFILAVAIIVVINMKFGKPDKPKSKKRRKRRQKSAERKVASACLVSQGFVS